MNKDDLIIILNALVEPVFLVNENRRITLTNQAADSLFGEELVDRDFVHAIRHPDALDCVAAALEQEGNAEATITLTTPTRATFRIQAVHLEGGNGLDPGAVVSLNDVSHILEAEQMRSDFVANVSHELRSPLTALMGGIETLKGAARSDPEARDRFLEIMEHEAARMNRLVGDLLSLSRVEVNEHVRPSGRVEIINVLRKVIATLETRSGLGKKTIKLEEKDRDWNIPGDEDELTQVFQNLIDNALKYSRDKATIEVTVGRRDQLAGINGPVLAVSVKDEGEGIPEEHIPRLTERFYRVDDSRSRAQGGTGLGLAIVKHILNRHRGRLLIESKVGAGSTFTACLPIDEPV